MKPDEFIARLDERRIVEAILAAERLTTGEIRVCISHRERADVLAAAERRFRKLGMHRTQRRNAILLYFVPRTRRFAVWGDLAVHEKCGQDFWPAVVEGMSPLVREARFTEAIVQAVQQLAEILARHFPADPGDKNELSNRVVTD